MWRRWCCWMVSATQMKLLIWIIKWNSITHWNLSVFCGWFLWYFDHRPPLKKHLKLEKRICLQKSIEINIRFLFFSLKKTFIGIRLEYIQISKDHGFRQQMALHQNMRCLGTGNWNMDWFISLERTKTKDFFRLCRVSFGFFGQPKSADVADWTYKQSYILIRCERNQLCIRATYTFFSLNWLFSFSV